MSEYFKVNDINLSDYTCEQIAALYAVDRFYTKHTDIENITFSLNDSKKEKFMFVNVQLTTPADICMLIINKRGVIFPVQSINVSQIGMDTYRQLWENLIDQDGKLN